MLIGPPRPVRARPPVVLVPTGIVGGVDATRVGSTTSPPTGASSSTPNWTRRRHPITLLQNWNGVPLLRREIWCTQRDLVHPCVRKGP